MRVVFFSNYLTHHQIPFCKEMSSREGVEFYFVSTEPMEKERQEGGWDLLQEYDFEIKAYQDEASRQNAFDLAANAHVMIIGSAPEEYVAYRMKHAALPLTLRYSERIYKGGRWRVLSPRGAILRFKTFFRYLSKPLYMLCASAYTAGDLAMLGSYLGRCFKWGYFPENKVYENIEEVISSKKQRSILWVARMIELKHPEISVQLAARLRDEGYDFTLDMVGDGPLTAEIKKMIDQYSLQDRVHLLGTMSPEAVRQQMETHSIFLFTSDQHEGWGAVLNEAMNSGCAVVANDQIGSVPFLLKNNENGYTYHKSFEQLYQQVKFLLDHPEEVARVGKNAYHTITGEWSAAVAADRLIAVCNKLLKGEKPYFVSGPCSKAKVFLKKERA